MRAFSIVVLSVVAGLSQAIIMHALAQSPTPGAGHGFLIDKHVAAGVTCAKCHTVSTAKAPETAACLSCHGGTYAKLAEMTQADQPNPHASHRGE
ncbi:MAG TPA: cytochrome c3 family protein, partial [Pseudolabrys sp.]